MSIRFNLVHTLKLCQILLKDLVSLATKNSVALARLTHPDPP